MPKPTSLVSPVELHSALVLATSAMKIGSSTQEVRENLINPTPQVTYSSWADEVEAADLHEEMAKLGSPSK